jgi:ketosteroid isomerase-like protein
MSQENVEVVRQAFADFAENPTTTTAMLEQAVRAGSLAPDAELDFSAMYPDGPILRGLDAWLGYLDAMPWGRSVKLKPERFFDVDDERVLVFMHVTAEGETSGVPVAIRNAYELTLRDGVVVRWKVYADQAEALEAARLESRRCRTRRSRF